MVVASHVGVGRNPVVLVTGFEPFGNDTVNPSWMAVQALHGRVAAGHRIVGAQLPTEFVESVHVLRDLMHRHKPALVVCTGQAAGRKALSLERIAINVDDARIADNAGSQPVDTPVVAGGPAAYFTGLPIKAMLQALIEAGVPAEVSQTAGTFVCNHVFYGAMHEVATHPDLRGVRAGLIHVPLLPTQGEPSMPLEQIVFGLRIAIECALGTITDIHLQAGALD